MATAAWDASNPPDAAPPRAKCLGGYLIGCNCGPCLDAAATGWLLRKAIARLLVRRPRLLAGAPMQLVSVALAHHAARCAYNATRYELARLDREGIRCDWSQHTEGECCGVCVEERLESRQSLALSRARQALGDAFLRWARGRPS